MTLKLRLALVFLQHYLHAMRFTHLYVRAENASLVVYSCENGEPAVRAIFIQVRDHDFLLGIAGPRGRIQTTPYVGSLGDLLPVLTGKLVAVLARWPDSLVLQQINQNGEEVQHRSGDYEQMPDRVMVAERPPDIEDRA